MELSPQANKECTRKSFFDWSSPVPVASSLHPVALILGGSSGIGEATAKRLAKLGYQLAIHGLTKSKIDKVIAECNEISKHNSDIHHYVVHMDFSSNPENAVHAVKKTVNHFGRLDVLVNSVGMFAPTSPSDKEVYRTWRKIMNLNVECQVSASLEAAKYLKNSPAGSMIFLSSVASSIPGTERFAYSMSKSALNMFAKCMARELAPQVRVNIVSPGPIKGTQIVRSFMNPELMEQEFECSTLVERQGSSEEIAEVIEFLITKGTFFDGANLIIDGGYSIRNTCVTRPVCTKLQQA